MLYKSIQCTLTSRNSAAPLASPVDTASPSNPQLVPAGCSFFWSPNVSSTILPQGERLVRMSSFDPRFRFKRDPLPQPRKLPENLRSAEPAPIRLASAGDIRFIDDLQKRFANCLGFLPKVAIENLLGEGHIRLAEENDDPAGYILSRPRLRWQPLMRSITQAAVAMDAQRRHHGLALLARIESESRAMGLLAIQACCAIGLDSNDFWRAAGFIPIVHMRPANVRGREIICWRKPLSSVVPLWFAQPPKYAGYVGKKPTTTRDPNRSTDAITAARNFIAARTHT